MEQLKKVRKWFWVWEFDKEEQWLNVMALSGWVLKKIGYSTYHFAPCEPGEYTVRLEMRPYDEEYIRLLEESGGEYIGHMLQWGYYRRKTADGSFDLFSDLDSRIAHLEGIGKMLSGIAFANLAIGLVSSQNSSFGWVNLLCCALLTYGLGRIHGKLENLKNTRLLQE